MPESGRWTAWAFALVGLLATAILGALLLTVTGRTRRIEIAVAERTRELSHEVAEWGDDPYINNTVIPMTRLAW